MARKRLVVSSTGTTTFDHTIQIECVYWFNPTTAAHTFEIDGYVKGICVNATESQLFTIPMSPFGKTLTVSTLGSGELHIYYDEVGG